MDRPAAATENNPSIALEGGLDPRGPRPRVRLFQPAALAARRCARYFLTSVLDTFLCLEQTMPNTGAARPVHPGTGQSCLGRRLLGATTGAR